MIYNVFIGLAIGIVGSIIIIGLLCIMLITGRDEKEEYRPLNKKSKKGKK